MGIGTNTPGQKLTVAGMIETTSGGIKFPDGTIQTSAPASTIATSWSLSGNAGITSATQFLGTTDAVALHLRVNDRAALRLEPTGGASTTNVIGGPDNVVDPNLQGAVIAGGGAAGQQNVAQQSFATIGGGLANLVRSPGNAGTIAGGRSNEAGDEAFVGGGGDNEASGKSAVVAGGSTNVAAGEAATIVGGSLGYAPGKYSFVAGGLSNRAEADGSLAAGSSARATHVGAILFNAITPTAFPVGASMFHSQADMEFAVHAQGGVRFITSPSHNGGPSTAGVFLSSGSGSWSSLSDRNAKHHFEAVDGEAVLGALLSVPVQRWSYRSQDPGIRHMGPTAQDFRAAFGLGESATTITGVDVDGVNMAAIQALTVRTNRLIDENATLRQELRRMREEREAFADRLARLEEAFKSVSQRPPK